MSDDLVAFLRGCLDEDERVARAAIRAHEKAIADFKSWRPADMEDLPGETAADWDGGTNEDERGNFWCGVWAGEGIVSIARMDSEYDTDTAAHIARWDPARVLAEVSIKRRVIDQHSPIDPCDAHDASLRSTPCETLRLLALPYAGRPGWQEEWAPDEEVTT